jgi:CubicO group peptidase (beta-lactamase class C family)
MTLTANGHCEAGFGRLADAFTQNFEDGLEHGASLSATYLGRKVVDLWAGQMAPDVDRPWAEDTIVPVASSGKIAAAASLLLLVDRGQVELDRPVADYWPEFAQGGKAAVTVREALSHRGGVPGYADGISFDDYMQRDIAAARLAAEPHWFGGAARLAYHNMTYGVLNGGIVQQVDGRPAGAFFADEIAGPIGADFQLGLTDPAERDRLTLPTNGNRPSVGGDGLAARILRSIGPAGPEGRGSWPSLSSPGTAITNGRGLARLMAVFANRGELDGRRFLSADLVAEAGRSQVFQQCPLMGWLSMGLGFGLHSDPYPLPTPTTMAWGGAGGSWGVADPACGLSLGYAPNNFAAPVGGDARLTTIGRAFRRTARELPPQD